MSVKVLKTLLDAYGYTYNIKNDELVIFVPEGRLIEWELRGETDVGVDTTQTTIH